jgi:hypothetical protein
VVEQALDEQSQRAVAGSMAVVAVDLAQTIQVDEGNGQLEPWRSAR